MKSKPKRKYPTRWGCHVDEGFKREYTQKYLQATIEIQHYKGTMLLRVLPEKPKKGAKHQCACPLIIYPAAWLEGDDLDALIEILREAKKTWLKAYRKAERELRKRQATKSAKKITRKKPKHRMHLSTGGTDWSYDD